MKGSVLSFLKAEWKVSDTGSAQCWASSLLLPVMHIIDDLYVFPLIFTYINI
jgi:hypothetical protein